MTDPVTVELVHSSAQDEILAKASSAETTMARIRDFQRIVRAQLVEGHDYARIAGGRQTLMKPGAEKIMMLLGVGCAYEILDKVEDHASEPPYFDYTVKALVTYQGEVVAEGMGNANTRERKYANQIAAGKATAHDLKNTVLKMAEKRAKVDAALHVGALSDIFTQDAEDFLSGAEERATVDLSKPLLASQKKAILAYAIELELSPEDLTAKIHDAFGHDASLDALTRRQAAQIAKGMKTASEKARAAAEQAATAETPDTTPDDPEVTDEGEAPWPGEDGESSHDDAGV